MSERTHVRPPLSTYCKALRPLTKGTKLRWADGFPPREYILMTITPTRAGKAVVTQVEYKYARSARHLFQHGTDRTDVSASIIATDQ